MGKIVGGITDAIGLTDHKGEKQAVQQAANATAAATALSKEQIAFAKEQLDFQKEQYYDWESVYGDLQKNMGEYYNNLDPDKLVSLGLENQQKEFQKVQTAIQRDFAQRGMSNSGQEIAVTAQNKVQNATSRAVIRSNADQLVNEQKMQFLGLGLGQGTQMLSNIGNSAANVTGAYNTGVNSASQSAASYLNRGTQLGIQNMQSMGDLVAAGTYAAVASDERQKENIVFKGIENGHKIYEFNYIGTKQKYKGVIAQDILEYAPEAVITDEDGYYKVDYSKLGLKMEAI